MQVRDGQATSAARIQDWSNIAHYAAATKGFSNSEQLFRTALDPIGPGPRASTLLVFNGLSWQRGGVVLVENIPAELRDAPLALVDLATGRPVAYEEVPGTHRQIVFFAHDVPAAGYELIHCERTCGPRRREIPGGSEMGRDRQSDLDHGSDIPVASSWRASPSGLSALCLCSWPRPIRAGGDCPAEVKTAEGPIQTRVEIARKRSPLPLTVVTTYRGEHYADLRFDVDLDSYAKTEPANQQFAIALLFPRGSRCSSTAPAS